MDLSIGIVDVDQHYYEPLDCCTRHLDASTPSARASSGTPPSPPARPSITDDVSLRRVLRTNTADLLGLDG